MAFAMPKSPNSTDNGQAPGHIEFVEIVAVNGRNDRKDESHGQFIQSCCSSRGIIIKGQVNTCRLHRPLPAIYIGVMRFAWSEEARRPFTNHGSRLHPPADEAGSR